MNGRHKDTIKKRINGLRGGLSAAFRREVSRGGGLRQLKDVDGRSLLFLVLSALATGASWLFYFRALQCGDASKVAPIDKLSVAITIFLSIVLLGEPAELKTIIGGLLITCGSLVLLL